MLKVEGYGEIRGGMSWNLFCYQLMFVVREDVLQVVGRVLLLLVMFDYGVSYV